MTEGIDVGRDHAADGQDKEAAPPRSLTEYLSGKAAASRYLDAIDKHVAVRPDEDERAGAVRAIEAEPKLLQRLPELMRAAVADKTPSGVKRPLLGFGGQIIRALVPEQPRWGQLSDATPESLIDPLARHVRKVRTGGDKLDIAPAELLFVTGLIIAIDRHDFDTAGVLATVNAGLNLPSQPLSDDVTRLRSALSRASIKAIENFALVRRVIGTDLDEARNQSRASSAQLVEMRERLRSAQDQARNHAERADTFERRISELEQQLTEAKGSIASVEGGAAHGQISLKGQMRRLLQGRLSAYVSDALEALEDEPYFVEIARERLEMIGNEIKEGVAWLDRL